MLHDHIHCVDSEQDVHPSTGLKFEDMPKWLGAISVVQSGLKVAVALLSFNFISIDIGLPSQLTSLTPTGMGKVLGMIAPDGTRFAMAHAAVIFGLMLALLVLLSLIHWAALLVVAILAGRTKELQKLFDYAKKDPVVASCSASGSSRPRTIQHARFFRCWPDTNHATLGYITPEITGKLPGNLFPNAGLKFVDIPHGLGDCSKVPTLDWVQMIAYTGVCKLVL